MLAEPVSWLYRQSLCNSIVPTQWKTSCITPIPKISQPATFHDFRPISITPILSRVLERIVVCNALYPLLETPDVHSVLSDQYAFRPTGSTTAALVQLLQDISNLAQDCPYVHVFALDFSKAFDTVRHHTLMSKYDSMHIDDNIYNWLVDYLSARNHCTKVNGITSPALPINASIIQGSSIGPVSYIVNASDLKAIASGNKLHKYADDTYLIVPSSNTSSIPAELEHIVSWSVSNNLQLNYSKCLEMIVTRPRVRKIKAEIPPLTPGIRRVDSLKILGVTVRCNLSMSDHVDNLIASAAQTLYALKTLKSHGMTLAALTDVCRATLVSKLTYAAPAWYGFASEADISRLQSVLKKAGRWGVWGDLSLQLLDLYEDADSTLFNSVLYNSSHVLHPLLPPKKESGYQLRERSHDRTLSQQTCWSRRNFVIRSLFKDMY
jgi:hypothetical protein